MRHRRKFWGFLGWLTFSNSLIIFVSSQKPFFCVCMYVQRQCNQCNATSGEHSNVCVCIHVDGQSCLDGSYCYCIVVLKSYTTKYGDAITMNRYEKDLNGPILARRSDFGICSHGVVEISMLKMEYRFEPQNLCHYFLHLTNLLCASFQLAYCYLRWEYGGLIFCFSVLSFWVFRWNVLLGLFEFGSCIIYLILFEQESDKSWDFVFLIWEPKWI